MQGKAVLPVVVLGLVGVAASASWARGSGLRNLRLG